MAVHSEHLPKQFYYIRKHSLCQIQPQLQKYPNVATLFKKRFVFAKCVFMLRQIHCSLINLLKLKQIVVLATLFGDKIFIQRYCCHPFLKFQKQPSIDGRSLQPRLCSSISRILIYAHVALNQGAIKFSLPQAILVSMTW